MEKNEIVEAEAEEGVTPEILEIIFLKEIASRLADIQSAIEPPNNKIISAPIIRHIPYHVRRTLNANAPIKNELIKDDISIGLGTVGRSGYIYNEGPGTIEIKIYDGSGWTDWISIAVGYALDIFHEDNTWLHTIQVKANKTTGATYELAIAPGLEDTKRGE